MTTVTPSASIGPSDGTPPGVRPAAAATSAAPSVALTLVVDAVLHPGGVTVWRGHTADDVTVRCVATRAVMRVPAPGEVWALNGAWHRHPAHGAQVSILRATLERPSGRLFVQALTRNTRDFPGIGVVRAQRLWEAHGPRVFDLLDRGDAVAAEALADTVGAELAGVLLAGWRAVDDAAKACRWLSQYGFPPDLAAKVTAIYAAVPVPAAHTADAARRGRVVWHLEDDPYRMLAFASWRRTDAAARQLGVAADDPRRLAGAVEAACARRLTAGHTWVPATVLACEAAALLDTPALDVPSLGAPSVIGGRAVAAAVARRIVVAHAVDHEEGYQLPGVAVMERAVGERVTAMRQHRDRPAQIRLEVPLDRAGVDAALAVFEREERYPLNPEQRDAVWMALSEPASLLLGGPGVGKTTVLKALHAVARVTGRVVHQAALSGRAARRMVEATGQPACTIAALLHRIDAGELVLTDEPLLVLDEASMCDLAIVYRLLRRLPSGVRLLLVGDPGQLPPIGFGLVLHVLAAGGEVPRTTLTRVMRQTSASGIPAVCAAIREGRVPALAAPDWAATEGVSLLATPSGDVADAVIDVLARLGGVQGGVQGGVEGGMDRGVGAAQIIGSVRRGRGGTEELNARLQRLRAPGRPRLNGRFLAGDPVIATRNDYTLGVMNGELATAVANDEAGGLRCRFDDRELAIPDDYLQRDLELAYAITCHKAQGSQFPTVIVPVTPSRLLDRTLLLTAVSRAQHRVILVGEPSLLAQAITAPPQVSQRLVGLGRGGARVDEATQAATDARHHPDRSLSLFTTDHAHA